MSRIGKAPVVLPAGVTAKVENNVVTVKGPKGELRQEFHSDLTVKVEENHIVVTRPSDDIEHRSHHGLVRALIHNMVVGVSEGYKKEMELVGVGYRAAAQGQVLELSLGYSHAIYFKLPAEIKVDAKTERNKNPLITLESCDKQLLGQVCAKIRSLRKPEPYKGKGIKFVGEIIRRKSGKSASAKVSGTAERPRMTVFRSNKQIYVQLVDDSEGKTLASASSKGIEEGTKTEVAAKVGQAIAEKALAAGITEVVFDRNGYLFHGRVKSLADAARNGGLKF